MQIMGLAGQLSRICSRICIGQDENAILFVQFRPECLAKSVLNGWGQLVTHRQGTSEADRVPVRLNADGTVLATGDVNLDGLPLLDDQLIAHVVEHQIQQFLASHGATPSKCQASASRIRNRARCSRLLTAGTLRFSISAISLFGNPSTSDRTYTSRNGSGKRLMASSMIAACSAASTGSSGGTFQRLT